MHLVLGMNSLSVFILFLDPVSMFVYIISGVGFDEFIGRSDIHQFFNKIEGVNLMNFRFQRLVVPILMLTLATLACGLFWGAQEDDGDGEPTPVAGVINQTQDVATLTPDTDALPPERGAEVSSEMGGFSFIAVPGWTVEEALGIAALSSPTADEDVGPSFMLVGGTNIDGFVSNDDLLEDFTQTDADVEFVNQRQITIAGVPSQVVDLEGVYEGTEVSGRIVVSLVSADQYFQMIGFAPREEWEQVGLYFDDLVQSLNFFEPEDLFADEELFDDSEPPESAAETEPPAEVEEPSDTSDESEPAAAVEEIRQWAAEAVASSEYSDPDWAAFQATGAPDTDGCGDYATAWASLEQDTIEWLELTYDLAVTPTEVNIYQSHVPDQVVRVELLDENGAYHEIYTAAPAMTDCPYVLSIPVEGADYQVVGVKITIDQSQIGLPWNEIDAVELVGLAVSGGAQPPAQPTKASGDTAGATSGSGEVNELADWRLTTYLDPQAPPENEVKAVVIAENGTVWIGGHKSGVTSLQDGVFTNYTVTDGLGSERVNGLAVAPDGTVWAGTGFGLAHFDGSTWTNYTKEDGLLHDNVYSVEVAEDGTVWAGTTSGVSSFDGTTWTDYTREDGLVDTFVFDLTINPQGNLWFATVGGVSYFDGNTWTSYTEDDGLSFDIVNTVAIAPDGSVWFGTASGGVSRFDGGNWTTFTQAADYDLYYVKAITVDQDGALWFATEGHGVYRYNGENWLNISKADGLPHDWVDAAAVAPDGSLWFGLRKEGVVSVEQ
jgi:sugar lactone lactonase YvrE